MTGTPASPGMIQNAMKVVVGVKPAVGAEVMAFGRNQADWDLLAGEGEAFLIERARLGRLTSYTELNVVLERRTGVRRFDFDLQAERAAVGHLLGLIVVERNRPVTGLMISALVLYLGGNDAGSGFYKLAQDLGELPPGALSSRMKDKFWVGQVNALNAYYRRRPAEQIPDTDGAGAK